jgi:hypothetical protein
MMQINFDAFYDENALHESLRISFVFRARQRFFGCCTLPSEVRWGVAVGQASTSKIVDIDTET